MPAAPTSCILLGGHNAPGGSPLPIGASYTALCTSPLGDHTLSLGEAFAGFSPISLLCGIWTKHPCHYLHGSNIPPLIDWTRRVIPVSDLPLTTETIILRIHRLTFPVISGRSLSTLIGISSYINSDISSVTGVARLH